MTKSNKNFLSNSLSNSTVLYNSIKELGNLLLGYEIK